jgi:hypothetical protein
MEQHEAAVLSKAAYDYLREGPEATQSELAQYGLEGYQVDDELSDAYSVVITRPDGSAVISYRGTDALEDAAPDFQILLGRHSPFVDRFALHRHLVTDRFERASQKFEATQAKHSIAYLTGHSLGGTQAISTARKHGVQSVSFNPGSSPLVEMVHAGVCALSECAELPQTIYTTGLDPISFSSYLFDRATDNVLTVPPKHDGDWLSHSLTHFLPPRRRQASPEPTWLQPMRARGGTGERRPFCEAYPELCPG